MKRIFSFASFWFLSVTVLLAGERADLTNARSAQAILGADVWSQVIRIENTGSTKKYPRTVHALVFEVAGILWFYQDGEGTQSFSLHRGRLEAEKADFAPLLADIHPGFTRWTVVYGSARIRPGHTVLTFETNEGVVVIDPVEPNRLRTFSGEMAKNATALSRALLGQMVSKALFVPVGDFARELAARYVDAAGAAAGGRPLALN